MKQMLFTIFDYLQYAFKRGRYGPNQRDGGMAMAYVDKISDEAVAQMRAGDAIFTQRLDSFKSWAMMYMTTSPIDHAAIYKGDGRIVHMTLDGFKEHSLRSVTKGARVLPVRFLRGSEETPFDPPKGLGVIVRRHRPSHVLPPRLQLAWVAVRIWHGFHPERFRWKFAADTILLALVLDALLLTYLKLPVAIPTLSLSVICMIANFCFHKARLLRNREYELLSHPDIGYYSFFRIGGAIISKIGTLVAFRPIGLLPAKAFLALGSERPDDPTPDKFQEFREGIRYIIEDLSLGPITKHTEDEQREQDCVEQN
ncbi:NlpC/P60 family protein [Sphingomonas sp. NBWT7]|nr:NlpC/P60 family protein [Sphingomonas sp. NBWT7]